MIPEEVGRGVWDGRALVIEIAGTSPAMTEWRGARPPLSPNPHFTNVFPVIPSKFL
jgi:hypothetical protein